MNKTYVMRPITPRTSQIKEVNNYNKTITW